MAFNPDLNRIQHGQSLQSSLKQITETQDDTFQTELDLNTEIKYSITFDGFPEIDLAIDKLASSGVELINHQIVTSPNGLSQDRVTVSIPKSKLPALEKKISSYLNISEETKKGNPRNQQLVQSISSLKSATLKELWSDHESFYPTNEYEVFWWEIWLPNDEENFQDFKILAEKEEIEVQESLLRFPERIILLAKGSAKQFSKNMRLLTCLATVRRSKATADFFDEELTIEEQAQWSEDLVDRTTFSNQANLSICILDTGINTGHPLLSPVITSAEQLVEDQNNLPIDQCGHGTGMGGLAIYGDLTDHLSSTGALEINYRLESVKIIDANKDNSDENHGLITTNAISKIEIEYPERTRIFTLATTTSSGLEHGKPSAWSSALDAMASDSFNEYHEGKTPRLIINSAGNIDNVITDLSDFKSYPEINDLHEVQNPSQAWNILTIGAITYKDKITEQPTDSTPLAPYGGLSPYSTTSLNEDWDSDMPLKPDLVFEGGNMGIDKYSASTFSSLSLLTTYHNIQERYFTIFNATSAASALASKFAAGIMTRYPELWPETVRALMVHSAEWTDEIKAQFHEKGVNKRKRKQKLIRRIGYGVPNLHKAVDSLNNSVVLIVENEFQPYIKEHAKSARSQMNLHDLPWPKEILQDLGETEVKLTVTLSYFIEPNPSGQAKGRYSYPSHQLRFDLKQALESRDNFLMRIDKNTKDHFESQGKVKQDVGDAKWLLGPEFRSRGSIHKDIWTGSAVDLAERNCLAIYPSTGWWRTRNGLQRWNSKTRYALIISIETVDQNLEVDLYTTIKNQIETEIKTPISIS